MGVSKSAKKCARTPLLEMASKAINMQSRRPTGKSSDVLHIQITFAKVSWSVVHYYLA